MSRFFKILKVRPGEERMVMLLVGLMLSTAAGGALGGNATEALFFSRFGVQYLPNMYIILGLFSFVTSMVITTLMGRIARQRLYVALPFVLGFTLIGEWLILSFNFKWFFAVMWLGMNVIGHLQGLLTWGLAGAACDTRQAKRLFPFFSAGSILGTVLGGLVTQPLAAWLHAENLLLLWAATMFVSFLLGRTLVGPAALAAVSSHTRQPGVITEMTRGYLFVRRSPIMQWVSYSAILFSICFFSLALPFTRGATAQYPDPDRLAGFLGLFQSLSTGAALLASLFFANRMFARFGIMPMLLVFPLIYLAGFGALAVSAPFALLVTVRFVQTAYMSGIADSSWQALFNVVPPEQRDQVRAFVGGVPEQAGTFIAGFVLLVGEQTLQPQQLYLVGLGAAAILVYIIWRASRAYGSALVEALRAGQPQLFIIEEQPFGGHLTDAAAVSVAINGLGHTDAGIRRVSAEILADLSIPEASTALVRTLADADPQVRVAALKGLANNANASYVSDISACLSDPEPDVRCQAIDSFCHVENSAGEIVAKVEPLLSDGDTLVRAQAAQTLLRSAQHTGARETLHAMAGDPNPQVRARALDALGESQDGSAFSLVLLALNDAQPLVRRAASRALVALNPQAALEPLIMHLNDDDGSVRQELAASLGSIGQAALQPLLEALANPSYEDAALMALQYIPVQQAALKIRSHAISTAQIALHYHGLALGLARQSGNEKDADGHTQLLLDSLRDKSQRSGLNTLRALGLLAAREAFSAAVEHLGSRDAAQRANALEILESVGEREIIRPLLAIWESGEQSSLPVSDDWLIASGLLDDPYAWLRACASLYSTRFVTDKTRHASLLAKLNEISRSDPDEFVREVAKNVLMGEPAMDTLATLSLMERILFLRRVPLFANLPPSDLKQLAAITSEALFGDGQLLARQGETGTEMFIIVSGEVQVFVDTESQIESSPARFGRQPAPVRGNMVARRKTGDYVGEMSIINQEPRSATLVADGAVRTLCIDQKQFESILRERPEISLIMMRSLSRRLKEVTEQAAKK